MTSDPADKPVSEQSGFRELRPGRHAPTEGRYTHSGPTGPVHVTASAVGNPYAGGLRTWNDPLIQWSLAAAESNPVVGEGTKELLPWALVTIASVAPDALGLFGPAKYSGPGPTGLLSNLGHRTRGDALAAELIVAACLVERSWASTDGACLLGGLRRTGGRVDFGVKHLARPSGRRTIESDVLLTAPGGRRGVDVKRSVGNYRHPPHTDVISAMTAAVARGEVRSFHWVSPGRFSPSVRRIANSAGLHLHEGVWPSDDDRARIRASQAQAIDTNGIIRTWQAEDSSGVDDLAWALIDAAREAYHRAWGEARDLREITLPDGFTYLFDTTDKGPPDPPARLVAAYGPTGSATQPRQPGFMRGFPLPQHELPLDRGHIIARSSGGAEGIGVNLIPQDRRLNRGWGDLGRGWRLLERLMAGTPGTFVWRRIVYDSADDIPTSIESLVIPDRTTPMLDVFTNRSSVRAPGSGTLDKANRRDSP